LGANRAAFERPVAHLGHCFNSREVLGPEPWRVTSGPDMCEVQILANKGRQGHAKTHNGPTPGKTAAVKVQHNGCDLLPGRGSTPSTPGLTRLLYGECGQCRMAGCAPFVRCNDQLQVGDALRWNGPLLTLKRRAWWAEIILLP
jgi:hypothetical protein